MAEFYTNLPPKEKDNLDKTIEKLTYRKLGDMQELEMLAQEIERKFTN